MLLLADKLRALGRYSVAEVLNSRFDDPRVRLLGIVSSLDSDGVLPDRATGWRRQIAAIAVGLPYLFAVGLVIVLMVLQVALGGMLATSWIQMVKAVLMLLCALVLAAGVLSRFGFSAPALFARVAQIDHGQLLLPGKSLTNPVEALSLGLGSVSACWGCRMC
jgi:cation/acetate symporter